MKARQPFCVLLTRKAPNSQPTIQEWMYIKKNLGVHVVIMEKNIDGINRKVFIKIMTNVM